METFGIILPRNTEDVIKENNYIEMILPYQSSTNELQLILSKSANTETKFYNGYLLQTKNGDIRRIVNYTGKSRVCILDKPLNIGKDEGDMICLYKRSNVCLYYDEKNMSFSMVKCDNRFFLQKENQELTNLQIGNLQVENEKEKAIFTGDIEIGKNIFIENNANVKNVLSVKDTIISKKVKVGDSINIYENQIYIDNFRINNNGNFFNILENNTNILKMNENNGIQLGVNQLKLKKDSHIMNNCTTGFLCISGDLYHKNNLSIFGEGVIQLTSERTIELKSEKTKISSDIDINGDAKIEKNMMIQNNLKVEKTIEANEVYISGELHCQSLSSQPEIEIINCKNGEIISVDNTDLLLLNNSRLLSFTVDILPSGEEMVEVEFRVPEIQKLFTNKKNVVFYINGYCDRDESLDPVYNMVAYTIPNTKNACLKFTANSQSIHTLSILCKYTKV